MTEERSGIRSSKDFIEVTGVHENKRILVGKRWITFITSAYDEQFGTYTIMNITDCQKITKLRCRERYDEIAWALMFGPDKED